MATTAETKRAGGAKDWCTGSGAGACAPAAHVICPDCAQTVAVDRGVILAHRDTKRVHRRRLNLELAQLEVAHAEKDLALAKAKLAKALKAVRQ